MDATMQIRRAPHRAGTRFIPRVLADGLVEVDSRWGHIQPIRLAPGVETVAELEVIDHIEHGLPLIDTRLHHFFLEATLPSAVNIPHGEELERIDELDPSVPAAFFCNGPQCTATPKTIAALLDHGYPPESILYYRGGIHDWMTLGLPVVSGLR
jgi:rhodanese-related sulfurtransferase